MARLYEKKHYLNFFVVTFPFLEAICLWHMHSGLMPLNLSAGLEPVKISKLIARRKLLTSELLSLGYHISKNVGRKTLRN